MKNMKKITALIMAVCMMLMLAACGGETAETTLPKTPDETLGEQIDNVIDTMESIGSENAGADVGSYAEGSSADFVWESTEGGVVITEYIGSGTSVAIPAQLEGQDVVAIGVGAFEDAAIVGVTIPDTVVTIDEMAFYYCMSLVEVKLGANVRTIGLDAFNGCVALTNVELNDGLVTIGERSFGMCGMLQRIEIPGTVELIDVGAFAMSGLTSVRIPGSVQKVGMQAFSTCKNLQEVVIESGVKILDVCLFEDCASLTRVEIPASVETLEFGLFMYSDNVTVYAPAGSAAEAYAVENGVNFKNN